MPRFSQPLLSTHVPACDPASWLPPVPCDDDLALGLECAHPMLQIDRWLSDASGQETPASN